LMPPGGFLLRRVAVSGTEQGYMPRLSRDWERRAQSRRAAELLLVQHWNPLPRGAVSNWASRLFACQQHAPDHAHIMSMQSAEL
jgi:hypothetical protein